MTPPDLERIRGLEEQLFDPAVRRAPDAAAQFLAEDFVEFGRSGTAYSREETVRSLAAESAETPATVTASDYRLTPLCDGVVLLTYRSVRRQGAAELHSLRSSIWKRIDGHWRMVFHQGTPAASRG